VSPVLGKGLLVLTNVSRVELLQVVGTRVGFEFLPSRP
jgi:hypothetical protein